MNEKRKENGRRMTVTSRIVMNVFMPPEDRLTSRFATVQDWLFNICDTEQPKKSIAEYRFILYTSSIEYTLYLRGVNIYEEEKNNFITHIEFEPKEMYFPLPKSEFENITYEQVKERLIAQLKDFTTTDKFAQSFFAKADAIITEFGGEIIWSK